MIPAETTSDLPNHPAGDCALFRREGRLVVPLTAAHGPWLPDVLSGTAVGPLVAALADDAPAPCPMDLVSLSINFLRPVPAQPLETFVRIVREGQKQQVLDIEISSAGKVAVRATALRLRKVDGREPPGSTTDPYTFTPPPGPRFDPGIPGEHLLLQEIDSRMVLEHDHGPGATLAWLRYRGTVFEGVALTPSMRAGLAADFGNGLSAIVDPKTTSYMNADLTLHLSRPPLGEWLHLASRTLDGGQGIAMVGTAISDCQGLVGWAHQALLLQPR